MKPAAIFKTDRETSGDEADAKIFFSVFFSFFFFYGDPIRDGT